MSCEASVGFRLETLIVENSILLRAAKTGQGRGTLLAGVIFSMQRDLPPEVLESLRALA